MDYLEFLDRLHTALRPRAYLETGVEFGASLRLSRTHSIAVAADARLSPGTILDQPWLKLYRETSDAFFRGHSASATLEGRPLDLAVIDGIHAFSQVVRELEQIERWGHADTVVVIHDVLPENPGQASRAFHDGMWTGDVWRIVPFLEEHRPDLTCWLVHVGATGALVVTGLD
jgi:cephalosporin hydroxylase